MKTGASLTLICIGAILAFAVTGNTSFFNVHTAGWVLMLVGVIGLLLPSRTAGWLGRRLLVRRTYPGGQVEHIPVPPYVARNPGVSALQAGLPSRPTLLDDQTHDLIEEAEDPRYVPGTGTLDFQPTASSGPAGATGSAPASGATGSAPASGATGSRPPSGATGFIPPSGATEVIEDLYEQP